MPPFRPGVVIGVPSPAHIFPVKGVHLWYVVFMSSTVHVTVRLPEQIVARIDAEAVRMRRSRSWVIAWILSDGELYAEASPPRSSKSSVVLEGSQTPGKTNFGKSCPLCGGLGGLHQKSCGRKK